MIPSELAAKLIALAVLAIVATATFAIFWLIERRNSRRRTLDSLLRRSSRISALQKLLAQADMSMRVGNFLGISALAGIAVTILAYVLSQRAEVAWITLLLGFVLPYSYASIRHNKRFDEFEELFPEAIDTLACAVRAGHDFTTALEMITAEVAEPVAGEFRQLFEEQKYGMPVRDALLDLHLTQWRSGMPLSNRFLMADRILVVDDEQTIREILSSMLTAANYDCQHCGSGADALRILEATGPFQVLIYDLVMKDLDGIALLERIKERYPDMSVVMLTVVDDISVVLDAIRNGAYDYLLKPFAREQLLNTVTRALEHHRLRVENRTYQTNLESLVKARTEQLQSAMSNLERSYDVTLEALGNALEVKDQKTTRHSRRVTLFTIAIAQALGVPREQIKVIARGALLHDIGKMAIPDDLLNKPGKLDPDEFETIKGHAYHGYQILKQIPFLAEASEIVYSHQEWYDGRGYPRQLRGLEIPLGARIVAIANALDSITSHLPYRPAQSLAAARAEIKRCSGRQFDPEIVKAFLQMPDRIWEDLRREVGRQKY
jgi:putative nucleotidyltransferase with HDIG domain